MAELLRSRVRIIGILFLCLTLICGVLLIVLAKPTTKEDYDSYMIADIDAQINPVLSNASKLNVVGNTESILEASKLIASVQDKIAEQKFYIERKKELENGRNAASLLVIIIGAAFSIFWIPSLLYLFIVKRSAG